MAKDKKEEAAASTKVGTGNRKTAKRNLELRRARRALRHLIKRKGSTARVEDLKTHIGYVERGERQPRNEGKRLLRQAQESREAAKAAAEHARRQAQSRASLGISDVGQG